MADADITLDLKAKGNATSKLKELGTAVTGIDAKMLTLVGSAAAVGAAVGRFVADGIAAYSDFDSKLSEINARTQLTEAEMDAVAETAKRMGLETSFSATDAAGAMLQLITSGSDAAEAVALLPDVLNLAAASGLELETTADGLTDVIKQFQLGTGEATHVVDTLTAAAGSSSATVSDMLAAMANGGVVAATYGLTMEQTAAALAVMAENGIKGAEAGTQLKSSLLQANRDTDASNSALGKLGIALEGAKLGFSGLQGSIEGNRQIRAPLPALHIHIDAKVEYPAWRIRLSADAIIPRPLRDSSRRLPLQILGTHKPYRLAHQYQLIRHSSQPLPRE